MKNKHDYASGGDKDQPRHQPKLISLRYLHKRRFGSLVNHRAHCESSDQTGESVFAQRTFILLVCPFMTKMRIAKI